MVFSYNVINALIQAKLAFKRLLRFAVNMLLFWQQEELERFILDQKKRLPKPNGCSSAVYRIMQK